MVAQVNGCLTAQLCRFTRSSSITATRNRVKITPHTSRAPPHHPTAMSKWRKEYKTLKKLADSSPGLESSQDGANGARGRSARLSSTPPREALQQQAVTSLPSGSQDESSPPDTPFRTEEPDHPQRSTAPCLFSFPLLSNPQC